MRSLTRGRRGLPDWKSSPGRPAWSRTLGRDATAGISVAFVLVPQSLAYAQLAGLPAEYGLFASALPLIAAAFLASSPYLQTGPTAGTALLVLGTVSAMAPVGGGEYVLLAALLAVLVGAWRLLLGLLGGGPLAYLMSQPVLLGFTAGSSLLIVASQLPAAFGIPSTGGNPLVSAARALAAPESWQLGAVAFGAGSVLAIVLGRRVSPLFPAVLLVTIAAILISTLTGYAGLVVGTLPVGLPPFTVDLPWSNLPALLLPSLVIALVGFAEPTAIARRYAAIDRHDWDPNREMTSQGVANLVSGFGGGFPIGGSFSRTALNRLAGARTRASGAITGLAVLAFLPASGIIAALPTAVLGAIVIVAVAPLITPGPTMQLWRYSRPQAAVAIVTFAVTLALAPRVDRAVLLGVALAVGLHLWRELRVAVPSWTEGTALHLRPGGVLYFASAPAMEAALTRQLQEHPEAERLVVHCGGLGRIDVTAAIALRAVLADARAAGMTVELADVPLHARRIISRVLGEQGS